MGRMYLMAGAAGVFLALAGFAAFQTWRLDSANEARGRLAEQVKVCAAENAEGQRVIDGLSDSLDAVVRERAAQADAAERALAESREARERIEGQLSATRTRLERIYEGDCQAWADMPVCPAVAAELRQ